MTQPAEPLSPEPAPAPQGGQVQVYNPSGALVSIPVSQLPDAQEQGYSVAPPQAAEAPIGFDTLKAGARGALRGATAGFADTFESGAENILGRLVGKVGAGDRYAAESKRLEAEHPTASTVGEMAGMAGGALAGEGLLAEGAGAAANIAGRGLAGISRTGELASGLVGRAGAGLASTGALGRAAVSGAELGARGAVEMGLYEGVKNLNEQMLGDAPLAAEKIFAAAADGAEGGAIFGAALGSGGSLVKSGAKGLAGIASDVASKNADKLQGMADDQRWKALNPTLALSKQAQARVPGGTSTVGEVLGRYGITGNSIEEAAKVGGIDEIGPRIDAAVEQVGQKLGAVTGASTATVPFEKINDALEAIIAPVRKVAGREGVVQSLEDYRVSLANKLVPNAAELGVDALKTPITIQDALFQRKGLDQLVYQESKSLDPKMRVQLLRDFRSKFEDLIVDSFDDAAKAAGNPNAKAELLGLKRDYQALSLAQDAAEASTSRMMTNRNLSLSDYMAGGTGSHIGGAIGSILGPVGTAAGSAIGGAAGAALNKFGRERGNAIAAAALDRLAAFGGKPRLTALLSEPGAAASALAREAAAADGTVEKVAQEAPAEPVAKADEIAVKEDVPAPAPPDRSREITYQPVLTRDTFASWSDPRSNYISESEKAFAESGKAIFGDRIPDAAGWQKIWGLPDGYHMKLNSAVPDHLSYAEGGRTSINGLAIEGRIFTNDDAYVGNIARKFYRDKEGKLVVKHDLLVLNKEFQGKGIGSELSKSSLEAYHQMGVDRIELHAAMDVGPYAWARAGYKFKPGEDMLMAEEFKKFALRKGLPREVAENLGFEAMNGPKALSEASFEGHNFGKEFLLSGEFAQWHGYKPVAEAHAEMLEKAAQFERAQQAIKVVDAQVEKAAKGIVEGAPKPEAISKTKSTKAKIDTGPRAETALVTQYRKARKEVDAIQSDPQALVRKASVGQKWLPTVSDHLGTAAVRAATFMTNATPSALGSNVFGQHLPDRATDADMHMFLEKYQVAKDPMSVLRQFSRGNITQTKAMALQVVSPSLFKQLQENAMAHVFSREQSGRPLPFEARQRLSLLLDIPTDPSQTPAMAKSLQSNIAPAEAPTDAPMGDMGKKKIELPDSLKESAYDTLGQR